MLQFEATQMFVWPCGDAVRLAPKLTQSLASVIYSWLLTAFSVAGPLHMIEKPCLQHSHSWDVPLDVALWTSPSQPPANRRTHTHQLHVSL
jgi:hypothetical protein